MLENPLLDAFLENGPDTERHESENALSSATQERASSKTVQSIWRFGLLFVTVCCIAVLRYSIARNYSAEENTGSTIRSGELKRVTHALGAPGDEVHILPREVASYLHRTSFHFQPEKNWMNGNKSNSQSALNLQFTASFHNITQFTTVLWFLKLTKYLCCAHESFAALVVICRSERYVASLWLLKWRFSGIFERHCCIGSGCDDGHVRNSGDHRLETPVAGPMYYKGFYHFFYQYNPLGAVWGDIVWGHAVSTDLIHWLYLDIALVPDQWYDAQGVWSGSVTLREDGVPIIIYTGNQPTKPTLPQIITRKVCINDCTNQCEFTPSGSSHGFEQTQNMAYPEDPSDPLLRRWVKDPENPILRHPPGIGIRDFRDPTTAWKDVDGHWLMTVGAKKQKTGLALLYKSMDLKHWELQENVLHSVPSTGMWECVDFYPVAVQGHHGLETYSDAPTVKYVLKASLDDTRHDHYSLGSYDVWSKTFHPDDPTRDTGIGLRYDYGKFYASKSFFDPAQQRRILWGWANESDTEAADIAKGWSSVQVIREFFAKP